MLPMRKANSVLLIDLKVLTLDCRGFGDLAPIPQRKGRDYTIFLPTANPQYLNVYTGGGLVDMELQDS